MTGVIILTAILFMVPVVYTLIPNNYKPFVIGKK